MALRKALPKKTSPSNTRNEIDVSATSVKSSAAVATNISSNKGSWLSAPLPQFYDLELATAMVKEGLYPSMEKAFIEVPETRKVELRERSDNYYKSCHSVNFWQNAPLPSPKIKK